MSDYRLKRGPALLVLGVVGLVGGVLILASQTRPAVDVLAPVTVDGAYEGTTYAFDGLVCVRAADRVGARVSGTQGSSGDVATQVGLRPEGDPPAVLFPVDPSALAPLDGLRLAAGEEQCVRVLARGDAQGALEAGTVAVTFRYGPLELLRRTVQVDLPVVLEVTGTGPDPRAEAG